MYDDLLVLAAQIRRLPGGAGSVYRDYFAGVLVPTGPCPGEGPLLESWPLATGGWLRLERQADDRVTLCHVEAGGEPAVLLALPEDFGRALAAVNAGAAADAVPPVALALLALGNGLVDDHRTLARRLPAVDRAAREMLLVASCRLCG